MKIPAGKLSFSQVNFFLDLYFALPNKAHERRIVPILKIQKTLTGREAFYPDIR